MNLRPAWPRCFTLFSLSPLVVAALLPAAGRADDERAATAPDPAKTHVLFMGIDIAIQRDKQMLPVKDVSGSSFVIEGNHQLLFVPMDRGQVTMRVDSSLKLTRVSASLENLKGERAYTEANDPTRRFLKEQQGSAMMAADALSMQGTNNAQRSLTMASAAAAASSPNGPYPNESAHANAVRFMAEARQDLTNNAGRLEVSSFITQGDFNNVGTYAGRMQKELDAKLFDAFEITFEASSEQPLTAVYMVIIATYREPGVKSGPVKNWIYAKSLAPIDRTPRKVHALQGGLPPGYELENYQVHLYNAGVEVATNVSPKRVPMTVDEAMMYVMMDYLATHKGATLPAKPVLTALPADFQSRLARGEGREPIFVRVSKEGLITEAFLDEECSRKLADPYFSAAMGGIRFKPALDQGKPVESLARLKLTDLPRQL